MEKRFLLFIFLSLAILTVYQSFVVKPVPPKPGTPQSSASSPRAASPAAASPTAAPTPAAAAPAAATPAPVPPPPDVPALVGDTSERAITIETRDVIAVFTNRGARLKSWRLKRYLDQSKRPQELVEQELPNEPLPFTVRTQNAAA